MDVFLSDLVLLSLFLIGLFLVPNLIRKLRNTIFVWLITTTDISYAFRWKMMLFGHMDRGKVIVEVGAGTGSNLRFYPSGSRVTCVEPLDGFQRHLKNNIARWGSHLAKVDILQCYGEDLKDHIPASSVNYAVCTYVLCSVTDVRKVLTNIYSILRPGGVLFYLEHTMSNHMLTRLYQKALTPVTSYILNGCHYNHKPEVEIEKLGLFKETHFTEELVDCMSCLHPERTQVWGRAIK